MPVDALGLTAGLFVLFAFYARRPVRLRGLALVSNVLFVLYGVLADLFPIMVLHAVLMPLNLVRLSQELRQGAPRRPRTVQCPRDRDCLLLNANSRATIGPGG